VGVAPPIEPLDYLFGRPHHRLRGRFSRRLDMVRGGAERCCGKFFFGQNIISGTSSQGERTWALHSRNHVNMT
jgi:hypothetical protein